MVIEFSDHALVRLKERRISKKLVVETIQKPEEIRSSFRGRKLLRRMYKNKVLEVITVREKRKIIVITEYWLEGE